MDIALRKEKESFDGEIQQKRAYKAYGMFTQYSKTREQCTTRHYIQIEVLY